MVIFLPRSGKGADVLHAPCLAQQKPIPQFIARINQKLVPSGDARRSFDLRNNRIVRAEWGRFYHPPSELGADDALDHDGFAGADLAASVMNGQTPTHACPSRRTIDLSFGEDTDVAAVSPRVRSLAYEDHAVKKAQILFKRMRDGAASRHSAFDRHSSFDQAPVIFGRACEPDVFRFDVGVKRPAEREIVSHSPQALRLDYRVKLQNERRHIM